MAVNRWNCVYRWALGFAITVGGSAIGVESAQGQANFFSGFTDGCFYLQDAASCEPPSSGSSTASAGSISYAGSTFEGTAMGSDLRLSLGTFRLGEAKLDNLFDDQFVLRTTFTSHGNASQLFFANILGLVLFDQGYAYLNFSRSPILFGVNNEYSLRLEDVAVGRGAGALFAPETAHLVGHISLNQTAHVTPEPVSMLLLGSGLAGIGAVKRRRRLRDERTA